MLIGSYICYYAIEVRFILHNVYNVIRNYIRLEIDLGPKYIVYSGKREGCQFVDPIQRQYYPMST